MNVKSHRQNRIFWKNWIYFQQNMCVGMYEVLKTANNLQHKKTTIKAYIYNKYRNTTMMCTITQLKPTIYIILWCERPTLKKETRLKEISAAKASMKMIFIKKHFHIVVALCHRFYNMLEKKRFLLAGESEIFCVNVCFDDQVRKKWIKN